MNGHSTQISDRIFPWRSIDSLDGKDKLLDENRSRQQFIIFGNGITESHYSSPGRIYVALQISHVSMEEALK